MASFPAVTLPPGEGCFVFCFFSPLFIIWSSICVDEYNHFQRIAKRSNCGHDLSCIQFFCIEKLKIWKDIRCVVFERELLKTCSDYEFGIWIPRADKQILFKPCIFQRKFYELGSHDALLLCEDGDLFALSFLSLAWSSRDDGSWLFVWNTGSSLL